MNVTVDQTGRQRLARAVDRAGRRRLPRRARVRAAPHDTVALDEHARVTANARTVEQRDVGDVERARHRQDTQGGTRIGDFQLVQAMLADQQTGVMAGRAMVREAARAYVTGADRRIAPSAAKLFCTEMVGKVADLAVQVHGGAGYMRDIPVERIYRDVRLLRLYEGTSEIQRLIIGGGLVRQATR